MTPRFTIVLPLKGRVRYSDQPISAILQELKGWRAKLLVIATSPLALTRSKFIPE